MIFERIQRADIEAIGGTGSGNESKVVSVRGDLKLLESNSAGARDLGAQGREHGSRFAEVGPSERGRR